MGNKTPPEAELSLSLLENGLDFIVKGYDELFGEDHSLKGAKATEVNSRNYKYGIMNLFSGFLLLLKERLSRHMPELIFSGKLADVRQKLQGGKRLPTTVDLDEALERLEVGPKVSFLDDDLEVIRIMQNFRNQIEHYKVNANKHQLWAEVAKFLDIIEKFLKTELDIDLNKFSKQTKELQTKAKALRERVVEFDSELEKQVFQSLEALAGKTVPGSLLYSNGEITLPSVINNKRPYKLLDGGKYTPDFEGEANSTKWIIEVKGAYSLMGGSRPVHLLNNVDVIGDVKKWLIVIGEVSANVKDFAREREIYITDYESWQEIEKMKHKDVEGSKHKIPNLKRK